MPIKINKLESARFGIVMANVVDNQAKLSEINIAAKKQNVNLLTQRINVGNLTRLHSLEEDGYRLMDTILFYERPVNKLSSKIIKIDSTMFQFAEPDDASAVADLAQKAFQNYFGHYHSDVRLDNSLADAAYIEWAQASTSTACTKAPVLLAKYGKKITGFIKFKHQIDQTTEIILNAVHPDFRRRGIYKALVLATLQHAHAEGAKTITASTQINNYTAQKIWTQLGFLHVNSLYTLHKWY
jgi:ribosomal protein S18 acetylase RimI-like enzyme